LLRRDVPTLIEQLAARPAIKNLALTTNGAVSVRELADRQRRSADRARRKHGGYT
jgi:molybdenum cofactor biosynthesis enzyme MoaA